MHAEIATERKRRELELESGAPASIRQDTAFSALYTVNSICETMSGAHMTHHYDVIIVGAGSSGCALAARLSENRSRSVLVLEAGHRYGALEKYPWSLRRANVNGASQPGSRYSWPFAARLTDEKSLSITRGKVVGGSSAVNVTLFTRGTPGDYDGWGQAGNAEWSYHKLLPSFIRQESDLDFGRTDVHGVTGPFGAPHTSG